MMTIVLFVGCSYIVEGFREGWEAADQAPTVTVAPIPAPPPDTNIVAPTPVPEVMPTAPPDAGMVQQIVPPTDILTPTQIFQYNKNAVLILRGVCAAGRRYTGSGFIVCSTGIAVTNHHVMSGLVSVVAVLYDGREFDILGYYSYDFANDLAVIQIDGRGEVFEYAIMGDSDTVSVGNNVFAVGGPDWDPITFTDGIISRIANEPISFNVYTITGMLQSTASIYGGNSGGPLLNDRGHVIGINSARSTVRASVQFAVPINRIVLPTPGSTLNTLPMGGSQANVYTPAPGQFVYYERFPFIPNFLSVSDNASLFFSGTPADLGLSAGDVIFDYYDFLFMYDLATTHFVADTDRYDVLLLTNGFVFQNFVEFIDETWFYFYNATHNTSLSYGFMPNEDMLIIAIVSGDVYTLFYH